MEYVVSLFRTDEIPAVHFQKLDIVDAVLLGDLLRDMDKV